MRINTTNGKESRRGRREEVSIIRGVEVEGRVVTIGAPTTIDIGWLSAIATTVDTRETIIRTITLSLCSQSTQTTCIATTSAFSTK